MIATPSNKTSSRIRRRAHNVGGIFDDKIVVHFAGFGGACLGLELATGRAVDDAINHDKIALACHSANHPHTQHHQEDVFHVDPKQVAAGRHIERSWFSPDCTHFARARGSKPVKKKIRALAWVVIKWAMEEQPDIIYLENVREFETWGPCTILRDSCGRPILDKHGKKQWVPIKKRAGETYRRWRRQLESLGYVVETKVLNAADFGVNTHRRRFFLIARRDGEAINWPEPTHGPGRDKPWRVAAECIDWDIPCPSIFLTKQAAKDRGFGRVQRPLKRKTLERVARGIKRYVIESRKPFIVRTGHFSPASGQGGSFRGQPTDAPLGTVCSKNDKAIVAPLLVQYYSNGGQWQSPDVPLHTIVSKARHGQVNATLAAAGVVSTNHGGDDARCAPVTSPMGSVTSRHGNGPVVAFLGRIAQYGSNGKCVNDAREPLTSIVSNQEHFGTVAHLAQFFGGRVGKPATDPLPTVTGVDHNGLVVSELAPFISSHYGVRPDGSASIGKSVEEPLPTVTSRATQNQLASAVLVGAGGPSYSGKPRPVDQPAGTTTAASRSAIATAFLAHLNHGDKAWSAATEPMRTVTGQGQHAAVAEAWLVSILGPGVWEAFCHVWEFLKEHLGPDAPMPVVEIERELYLIVDIGLRMLKPRELLNAQFTPELAKHYRLIGTISDQVRMIGNSVPPLLVKAIVEANPLKGEKLGRPTRKERAA